MMGKMCQFFREQGVITARKEQELRLAALLHDIGHYPLSHLGEQVYMLRASPAGTVSSSLPETKSPLVTVGENSDDNDAGRYAHHEQLGTEVIKKRAEISTILKKSGISPSAIAELITGGVPKEKLMYAQLMHSSLDCDRLDYLSRDSFLTGVNYGKTDVDYLIRLLRKGWDPSYGCSVVGVDIRGRDVVEHYLMARYFYYVRVVGHKTVRAFEAVAKAALYLFLEDPGTWVFKDYAAIRDRVDSREFLDFHDSKLMQLMEDAYDRLGKTYQTYWDTVKHRRRPRVLCDVRQLDGKPGGASNRYYNLKRALTKDPEFVAKALKLPLEYVGWHEFGTKVERLPANVPIEKVYDTYKFGEDDDRYREAVRLVDCEDSDRAVLLVSHPESIVGKLTDFTMKSLIVFYIEPSGDSDEEAEKRRKRGLSAVEDAMK